LFTQIKNYFLFLDLWREVPKDLIVTIIVLVLLGIAKVILTLLCKKCHIPKLLAILFSIKQPSESSILPDQANTTSYPVRENFMINIVKYCKEHLFVILLIIFLGYIGYSDWRRSHPVQPTLEDQPMMFYIHSNDSETYPELGLVISLQSVKTFGTKDEIGAKGFRLVTYEQDPNQNSQIRKKHVKVIEKESVEVGDYWDFQIDDIWYRIVFKFYTLKESDYCAAFELSLLGKKKD